MNEHSHGHPECALWKAYERAGSRRAMSTHPRDQSKLARSLSVLAHIPAAPRKITAPELCKDYDEVRPHSSCGQIPPAQFAALQRQQRNEQNRDSTHPQSQQPPTPGFATYCLLSQYLPKRTDLSVYSQDDLNQIALSLNTRPRQRYGFYTPLQAYNPNHRLTEAKLGSMH